jgi:hypothetical protein
MGELRELLQELLERQRGREGEEGEAEGPAD